MECRVGCGACCIAISISSPLPGHPEGKEAGVRCVHLTVCRTCSLWGTSDFPDICRRFDADEELCGKNSREAELNIIRWEKLTRR